MTEPKGVTHEDIRESLLAGGERFDTIERTLEGINEKLEVQHVNKLDLGVLWSIALSVVTFAFGVGLYFGTILEQGRRIDALERDRNDDRRVIAAIQEKVTRIDANVEFLAERAREDRQKGYR